MLAPALLRPFLVLAALLLAAVPLLGVEDDVDESAAEARKAVNAFFAEYNAFLDSPGATDAATAKWIARCPRLTAEFKAAYAREFRKEKGFSADPILSTQERDPKGQRVVEVLEIYPKMGILKVECVSPGYSGEPLIVHLRREGGKWRIQRVNDFGGEVIFGDEKKYRPKREE